MFLHNDFQVCSTNKLETQGSLTPLNYYSRQIKFNNDFQRIYNFRFLHFIFEATIHFDATDNAFNTIPIILPQMRPTHIDTGELK